nr:hypothetical protein [uncultured Comamonas sp.]
MGGNLHIESLQDSSTYASRSQSIGGSITISPAGVPTGGSFNAGKSKVDSNYLSVVEQSGIKAGDGGFDVQVQGDTSLKGAVIASNQVAVEQGKNHFSTEGELTTSDLQNSAKYEGKAVGVSASVGNDNGKFGVSGVGAGVGQDSGSASSTTTAGISGIAGDQSVRSTDAETGIQRIFDKEKVQKEIDAQVAITAEFGKQAGKAVGDYAEAQMKIAEQLRSQGKDAEADAINALWGDNGSLRLAAHTVVGGLTGGIGGAAGAAAGTLTAPAVAQALREAGITGALADVLTAAASTAAGAVTGGVSGTAAAGNEVANNYLTHNQTREKEKKLASAETEDDKKKIIQEYAQLDEKQREEAGMCLVNDQCQSVFDKESLKSVLNELNTACSPPRYCTADEKASIQELNQFYAIRDSVKPDTLVEEILFGNKVISSAFKGVVAFYGKLIERTATDNIVNTAKILSEYGNSSSKMIHVFDDFSHNLGPLVTKYGSNEAAFSAVHTAAQKMVGQPGVVTAWIDVGGNPVWVRGMTVNGSFRIGSFSGNTMNPKYPLPRK